MDRNMLCFFCVGACSCRKTGIHFSGTCANIRSALRGEARMATAGRGALPRPLPTRRDHGPPGCARAGRKTGLRLRRLRDKASLGPQHFEKLQMRARRLPAHTGGDAVAPAQMRRTERQHRQGLVVVQLRLDARHQGEGVRRRQDGAVDRQRGRLDADLRSPGRLPIARCRACWRGVIGPGMIQS